MSNSGWETFTKRGVPRKDDQAYVGIQRQGQLSLNRRSWELLGEPENVELLYHPGQRMIGIKASSAEVSHSYPVRRQAGGAASFLVAAMSFMSHYEIPHATAQRYLADLEGDILAISLDKPLKPVSSGGRKPAARPLPGMDG